MIVYLGEMDGLTQLDYRLFFLINDTWSYSFLDWILPLLRERYFWFPLYVFIIVSLYVRHRRRTATIYLLSIISCFVIADMVSSQVFKKTVQRIRPCNERAFESQVMERVHCGYGYSFPSSHATNHFAISFFLIALFGFKRWTRLALIFWAGIISYAQVYVGVHYPLDVLGGALLGILIARLFYSFLVYTKVVGAHSIV